MIAFDSTGRNLVLCDDAELLVHDGPSEGPRWRRDCKSPLVAVGATADAVISLDEDGQAIWYDAERDHPRATADAGDLARSGAVSPAGHVLVATAEGAVELTPQGPGRRHPWPGATAVAWGVGGQLLIGDEVGKVGVFGPGGLVFEAVVDGPVVAAAWNPRGFWVVATARELLRLEGGAVHHLTRAPAGVSVRGVACSLGGDAIGLHLGHELVVVLSWPERATIAQLRYLDRSVTGLQFGPEPWLAVGLDGGDGNKLDLTTGGLHRTDTHPGREHRRWRVQVSAATRSPPAPPSPPEPVASAAPEPTSSGTLIVIVLAVILGVLAWLAA